MRGKALAACGVAAALGAGLFLAIGSGTAQDRKVDVKVRAGETKVEVGGGSEDGPGFYRATEVIGTVIKDEASEQLGTVRDIVIDGQTQQVQYLLLAEGDAAATSVNEFIVLPFAVVRPHFVGRDRFFVVAFNRQRFNDAPRITINNLNNVRQTNWMVDADKFFGVTNRTRIGGREGDRRDGARERGDVKGKSVTPGDSDTKTSPEPRRRAEQPKTAPTNPAPKKTAPIPPQNPAPKKGAAK